MNRLSLPGGVPVPTLGLGTAGIGESREHRAAEVAAVRSAIEMGYRLIDQGRLARHQALAAIGARQGLGRGQRHAERRRAAPDRAGVSRAAPQDAAGDDLTMSA